MAVESNTHSASLSKRVVIGYNPAMDFSIVIPVYNEVGKIARDIEAAAEFLAANRLVSEIIVSDDGSIDSTVEKAEAKQSDLPEGIQLKIIRSEHRGKGHTVRRGMAASSGKYIMFADSGYCVPYGNALLGLEMLKAGQCDITHGSRKMVQSDIRRGQSWYRRVISSGFRFFIRKVLGIDGGLSDTQCGFKVYKGDVARKLYGECICDGFMFDVEIILRAQKKGYRIKEFPVEWTCDLDSRLSVARTPVHVLSELVRIKKNLAKDDGGVEQRKD